jgi:hypothetical protein
MCDPNIDGPEGYCEKFNFQQALHSLAYNKTTEDQHGVVFIRQQYVLNLMEEYECSI